jgi:hypothetical protein
MVKEQDAIGWRQFMESMICRSMMKIHYNFHYWGAQGLILKLLEAIHGQWIYRNI